MALSETQGTAIQPIQMHPRCELLIEGFRGYHWKIAGGVPTVLMLIRWQDASHDCHGQKPDEMVQDYLLETVGFFVKETDTHVSISHEACRRDGTFRHTTHIPLSLIQERIVLDVARLDPQRVL